MDKKDQTLAKQVLFGLGYTDQFSFPLTVEELWQRLPALGEQFSFSKNTFLKMVFQLEKQKMVSIQRPYTMIFSKKKHLQMLIKIRNERATFALKKLEQSRELLDFLQRIPFISGVLVTGSVSMLNARSDDDVDFLIITKPHTLWVTRPFVIFYSWLKGKRRSWKKEEKNSWCFNFWLEETALNIPKQQQTLYTAYELLQAHWLLAEPRVQEAYYQQNKWAYRKVPRLYDEVRTQPAAVVRSTNTTQKQEALYLFFYFPIVFINRVFYILQRLYMKSHQTTERVGRSHAFFHPRDTRGLLYQGLRKSLLRLMK